MTRTHVATEYPFSIDRYEVYEPIASGGMASVHLARLLASVGFARTVAIKRLHPQFAREPEFVAMFVDEARMAARIRHPNVVPTLDVVQTADELFLVMEYIQGESLSRVMRRLHQRGEAVPFRLAVTIASGVLHGLHAAHSATGESGERLHLVHRDVSPHNILVGCDGVPRIFDFGIAKARGRLHTTQEGQIKGKLAYMAPEQTRGDAVGAFTDTFALGVVLWEMLAGRRMFDADTEVELFAQVLRGVEAPPSAFREGLPAALDDLVMKALALDPSRRFESARAMANALEATGLIALPSELGDWVQSIAGDTLQRRSARVAEIESRTDIRSPIVDPPSEAVTEIQAVVPLREDPPRRRGRWLGALALVLALGGAGIFWLREPTVDTKAAAPAVTTPSPAPSATPTVVRPSPAAPAESAPTASAAPTGASSGPPPAAPSKVFPRPRPLPAKTVDCDPPFYFDADGIKQLKPSCL